MKKSSIGSQLAKLRWKKTSKVERLKHITKMNEARKLKRLIKT